MCFVLFYGLALDCRSLDHDAKIFEVIEAYCQSSQNRMTLHSGEQQHRPLPHNRHPPCNLISPPLCPQQHPRHVAPGPISVAAPPTLVAQDATLIVAPPRIFASLNPQFSPNHGPNKSKHEIGGSRRLPDEPPQLRGLFAKNKQKHGALSPERGLDSYYDQVAFESELVPCSPKAAHRRQKPAPRIGVNQNLPPNDSADSSSSSRQRDGLGTTKRHSLPPAFKNAFNKTKTQNHHPPK